MFTYGFQRVAVFNATQLLMLLYCCCTRSEEASLVSRQKDSEAANSSSRLASTKPSEAKAPLAKVNGAADAAADSSSSSIVQRVWEDVLRLATGVSTGVGSSQLGTPAGAAAAAAVAAGDAAQMRRKALELIEAVLRGGLVAPWSAVAPLVALLTDEAVDTRQAALKVSCGLSCCARGGSLKPDIALGANVICPASMLVCDGEAGHWNGVGGIACLSPIFFKLLWWGVPGWWYTLRLSHVVPLPACFAGSA